MAVNINGTGSITGLSSISSPTISGGSLPAGTASAPGITFSGDSNTGIYSPGADKVAITTSGTERLIVDDTGKVGIGTTSPTSTLQVSPSSGSANFQVSRGSKGLQINQDNDSADPNINTIGATALKFLRDGSESARFDTSGRLLVGTSSTSATFTTALLQGSAASSTGEAGLRLARGASPANGDALGTIVFSDNNHGDAAYVFCARDGGTWSASSRPTRLVFSTTADGASSPTERFRIANNGNCSIGNSSYLHPQTDNAVGLGLSGLRWTSVWAANGTIQTSDERAKTAISNAQLGTDFVKSLRPVSFKWIEGGKKHTGKYDEGNNWVYETVPGQRTHWGFIAQEVKEAVDAAGVDFGGWVLTDKNDPDSQQALRYDQFIAPLTKALQETMAELEALKAEVAALKAQ